ncbi:sensor histidine kinase [Argonema antarcticum]|uniref:sensor histidine kinase n=1 Tax=Argonema antarcticum TaxID=2942763 RepID=UPI0020136A6E|nr:ATP-binding protein [Argonema antarcticum]MCL1475373.1 cell wall metabolism sensor histidine kinase WalK [Argonema antarcticum A004/B2]
MSLSPIRIRWNSIHTKLLASYLALTALGTSVLAGYILMSFHAYFMKSRQADLDAWTTALSETVADALEENKLERVNVTVQRYGAPETVTLRVFAPDGRLLSTSAPDIDRQVTNWLEVPGMREAFKNKMKQGIAKGVLTKDDRLYVARPIYRNGRLLGVLRMSITLKQFQRQFQTIIWTILGTLVLTFILCAAISEYLTRNIARPIQAMCNFAIRMGGGHFGDKLSIRQGDEVGQLAAELNRMSMRLASLDNERRSFLASVSHELRTPVSNVFVTLEALTNGAAEEPELRDRFIQTAQDETKRLSRLIHDLLDLGRLEAGITALEQQTVKLKSLINRAVQAMETRMKSSSVGINLDVADIELQGDPERLLQAFLNVLDNAIKFSGQNSKVFICAYKESSQVMVEFRDRGLGITDSDMPHIFEQFYTADRSRKGSGTGLGLAIARRIVEAHGGSITATSNGTGKGATLTICLPLESRSLV